MKQTKCPSADEWKLKAPIHNGMLKKIEIMK